MASLSKEDRIAMSKKIISIPDDFATVESVKVQIELGRQEAVKNDAVNAALQDPYDEKIDAYQKEYNLIDGKLRTELTEDRINAAAKGENRNGFFLADPEFPIPTVPDGVWKAFAPMSYTYAIGKKNDESYDTEPLGEQPTISRINSLINQIEAQFLATRASGQKCIQIEVCVPAVPGPGETCTLEDQVVPSPEIQGILSSLKTEIQTWENSLGGQKSSIQINDADVPTRQADNQTAYDKVDPLLAILNGWQSVQDFDTTTSLPQNCDDFENAGYSAYCLNPDNPPQTEETACVLDNGTWVESFQDSKLSPTQIQIIKDAIAERSPFLEERVVQLDTLFGTIDQGEDGAIKSQSGWYGARFLVIDSRLNLISGSANGKFGAEKALSTQDQIQGSNETTAAAYDLSMKVTKAVAPGLDTTYLNVLDASEFSVGDSVYVVAENQEELSGTIEEKIGNRVKLTFKIPKKYTLANKTRLYRLVTTPI